VPWRRSRPAPDLDPDRPDLVVVAAGFDDAEASSAALERAASLIPRWIPSIQVVLRHHLLLPAGQVDDAVAVAAQDGYRPAGPPRQVGWPALEADVFGSPPVEADAVGSPPDEADAVGSPPLQAGGAGAEPSPAAVQAAVDRVGVVSDARLLVLQRVQVLDALHCSQERSRMAGLAQRRGGVALGWEALQPPPHPA
jgi:hypothetical protein